MNPPDFDEMQNRLSLAAEAHDLDHELTFEPMFGGICAYIQGRVFASLSDVGIALKLSPQAQNELLQVPGAKRLQYKPSAPFSKQYIVIPAAVQADKAVWEDWFKQSVDYVLSQPAPKSEKRTEKKLE